MAKYSVGDFKFESNDERDNFVITPQLTRVPAEVRPGAEIRKGRKILGVVAAVQPIGTRLRIVFKPKLKAKKTSASKVDFSDVVTPPVSEG